MPGCPPIFYLVMHPRLSCPHGHNYEFTSPGIPRDLTGFDEFGTNKVLETNSNCLSADAQKWEIINSRHGYCFREFPIFSS